MNQLVAMRRRLLRPAFDMQKRLPSADVRDGLRPTIVGVLITDKDNEILTVQPKKADPHGWIFPQGGIHRDETPLQALQREVEEELGYRQADFDWSSATALLQQAGDEKCYYVVAVRFQQWRRPQLNGENRQWATVGGPGALWQQVEQCSRNKRQVIARSIRAAVYYQLLYSQRWQERHDMLHQYLI